MEGRRRQWVIVPRDGLPGHFASPFGSVEHMQYNRGIKEVPKSCWQSKKE